jgi:hypothetical protein
MKSSEPVTVTDALVCAKFAAFSRHIYVSQNAACKSRTEKLFECQYRSVEEAQ